MWLARVVRYGAHQMKAMNTLLKITSFILAAAVPATFAADVFGFALPTVVDPLHVFSALVASLTMLTLHAEYRSRSNLSDRVYARHVAARCCRFPLAA